jgi:hypothetical protein
MYDGHALTQCGFEAVFLESDGRVEGNILDDNRLGEANVSGSFSYPSLAFVKTYYSRLLIPIHYEGTMSEDGKVVSGNWHFKGQRGSGTWRMERFDPTDSLSSKIENEQVVDDERERQRPMVAGQRSR